MLRSIKVKNFQKHESKVLRLEPGLNCIVGPNGAGKSGLIRAAFWACFNQPVGDWMLRHGESSVKVLLTFDDCEVGRRKGAKNVYTLDGEIYVSFGAGKVPDDIAKALNLTEANFQSQDDGAFWFGESPGEVSRRLNAIVDLSVIDESLANSQAILREARAATAVCKKRLEQARLRCLALAWVPAMMEKLKRLKELDERIATLRERSRRIVSLIEEAHTLTERSWRASNEAAGAAKLVSRAEEVWALQDRALKLRTLLDKISDAATTKPPPDYAHLDALAAKIRGAMHRAGVLKGILERIGREEECLRRAERSATTLDAEIQKRTGGRCPLCGAGPTPS